MKEKRQVVHIHGGSTWKDHDSYLEYLKTCPVSLAVQDKYKNTWYRNYYYFLDNGFYEVISPIMPLKYNAKYNEWKIWFQRYIPFLREGVILVGHSLGGLFLAKYLSENLLPVSIEQLHLVAPVYDHGGNIKKMADFRFEDFPGKVLEGNISEIHLYHSRDDYVVPFADSEKYHQQLPGSTFHVFEDRGHFLDPEFPELFENITKMIF